MHTHIIRLHFKLIHTIPILKQTSKPKTKIFSFETPNPNPNQNSNFQTLKPKLTKSLNPQTITKEGTFSPKKKKGELNK